MLWTTCVVTFSSFCRSGEVTVEKEDQYDPTSHLSYGYIAVDNPTAPMVISIMIKKSKTDQGRMGVKVFIGKTSDDLCPVTVLLSYLALRGAEPGPLFHCESGAALSKSKVTASVLGQQQPQQSWGWNSRQMGKFIVQEIYLTGPPLSGIIVTNSGPMPNLVLEQKERHLY